MTGTQDSEDICTKLERVAELARKDPEKVFHSLHHFIDMEWMREAYRRTRKDGASGVDGQTSEEYERELEKNLQSLLERLRSGRYVAPPVRRVHIPKGDGRTRPIGIPTFEDKVLQRAVTMLVEALYEPLFYDASYGFRPGRSAHDALRTLRMGIESMGGGWVLDVDIQSFFDTIDHAALRSFLDERVTDGVVRRVVHKWLKAGVMESGAVTRPEAGTPQGGVISPLLANVYLHGVLDVWFHEDVLPRLRGRAFLVRYADDFVVVCEHEQDARRIMDVLPKRFGKYGLTLHPKKTRLVPFTKPSPKRDDDDDEPGTFQVLGFSHLWARSRQGKWGLLRKTAADRFGRALARVRVWCRQHRHDTLAEQSRALAQKLRGHFGYYGIAGNSKALWRFKYEVLLIWRKWLSRRSQRSMLTTEQYKRILARFPLPDPVLRLTSVSP